MQVLRHPDRFINGYGTTRHKSSHEIYVKKGFEKRSVLGTNRRFTNSTNMVDPHFNLQGSAKWSEKISDLSHSLIDSFCADGEVEFLSSFALPLPVTMITTILGLPSKI